MSDSCCKLGAIGICVYFPHNILPQVKYKIKENFSARSKIFNKGFGIFLPILIKLYKNKKTLDKKGES